MMMAGEQLMIFDGTFQGLLCAVFDIYEYRFGEVNIQQEGMAQGSVFSAPHLVATRPEHANRVWEGLAKKIPRPAMQQVYHTWLSEQPEAAGAIVRYMRYAFSGVAHMEKDYGHEAVRYITDSAKKVHREKHRMEAFVRFQRSRDNL
ncbi:MAG: TIGR03915 family putative DNA repair protein, partial [Taibaiella sp.]|nr:TIGR03915 family putative DNA repair protein [Taibaiella sp.]